jgi:ligand-binding SRPBCC domain-containing protein
MTEIVLETIFHAPIETVFRLSANIDVHQQSARKTREIAIAGVTSGNITLGETVTWKGRHFGVMLTHQSRITAYVLPDFFVDEMQKGCFKSFRHEHHFEYVNGVTTMTDKMFYETPFGIFGKLFDWLLLKKHMTQFLLERNSFIKSLSEGQQ